eukprot:TRINITY_DN3744_c0_g2_i3.p1 TRINITY_DN3744_c0_g2~~TRINITY_DN3744_c0_g2_i3.p1  ORF type:complete len:183 (-),score=9.29 TRINITY_DN3744_c0_g2_i3:422-970(-)
MASQSSLSQAETGPQPPTEDDEALSWAEWKILLNRYLDDPEGHEGDYPDVEITPGSKSESVRPEGLPPQKCDRCKHVMFLHSCTHSACLSSSCVPAWFDRLRQEHWCVPRSLAGLLRSDVFATDDRCPACRPEAFCSNGAPSTRCCSNIIKRGKCTNGAKCGFCHLHGKGGRCPSQTAHSSA